MSDTIEPLDTKEQQSLVALFQAYLQLPNAANLRLHFYADCGGGLTDVGGKTIHDERLVVHWHDMDEGMRTVQAMREESEGEHETC